MPQPESLKDITQRLVREFREERDKRSFGRLLDEIETRREPFQFTPADRAWLSKLRIEVDGDSRQA